MKEQTRQKKWKRKWQEKKLRQLSLENEVAFLDNGSLPNVNKGWKNIDIFSKKGDGFGVYKEVVTYGEGVYTAVDVYQGGDRLLLNCLPPIDKFSIKDLLEPSYNKKDFEEKGKLLSDLEEYGSGCSEVIYTVPSGITYLKKCKGDLSPEALDKVLDKVNNVLIPHARHIWMKDQIGNIKNFHQTHFENAEFKRWDEYSKQHY